LLELVDFMILANVAFGSSSRTGPKDQLEDVAESYLATLLHSGQLCGEYFVTWTRGVLNAHVLLAGPHAHDLRYHSDWGKRELKKVVEAFGKRPVWKMLDDESRRRAASWKGAPFLYLFTHAFDWASPVCRGDGKGRIPIFDLPISFEQKDGLYSWQRSYRDHDRIWLAGGALEIAAYRQLADPESELSRDGRDLCRDLGAATGIPTFHYMMRYWARKNGEGIRKCPGCGGHWRARSDVKRQHFWDFDFRCEKCRLISHEGVSTDGGRHTRIGEFKQNKHSKKRVAKGI
jgi:predicted  nucleic acid-binding Zn ribbon protein